jgi:hypothetical protein
MDGGRREARVGQLLGKRRAAGVGQTGHLDRAIPGRGDGTQRAGQVLGGRAANRPQLQGDLVVAHGRTVGHCFPGGTAALRRTERAAVLAGLAHTFGMDPKDAPPTPPDDAPPPDAEPEAPAAVEQRDRMRDLHDRLRQEREQAGKRREQDQRRRR